jgi:tetratricopeptide (TPR) repeat protein
LRIELTATKHVLQRWGVVGAVWASALVIGGVLPSFVGVWTLALGGLVALGAAGSVQRWPAAVWMLLGLGAYSALQCIPVPPAMLSTLDARTARIWSDAHELIDAAGTWAPLSLEPESTRLEATKWVGYAALWALAARFVRHYGLRAALAWIWTLALVIAALSALHQHLDASRVYGVYQPVLATGPRIGPLLNPNNLAGLLNLGALCALGWALHPRGTPAQTATGVLGAATLSASSLMSGSRGGAAAIAIALAVYAGVLLWMRRGRVDRAGALAMTLAVMLGGTFFFLGLNRSLATELLSEDSSKLELLSAAAGVATEHPLFGVGRGAMGPELGRLFEGSSGAQDVVFVHAENWPLEWLAGWGLLVGGASVLGVLWAMRPRAGVFKDACRAGAYLALLVVLLQNLVDLGLEIPGVAAPCVFVLAALCVSASSNAEAANGGQPSLLPKSVRHADRRWAAWSLGLAALLAGAWTLIDEPRLAEVERLELHDTLESASSADEREQAVYQALSRHPGDAYVMRLGALTLLDRRDTATLRWLNQALLQRPGAGRTYLLLAETLGRMGRTKQAVLALRQGLTLQPDLAGPAARWALANAPQDVEAMVPEGPARTRVLLALASHAKTAAARLHWTELARGNRPTETNHLAVASATLDAMVAKQPPCSEAPQACRAKVHDALDHARETGATDLDLLLVRARLLSLESKEREAYESLKRLCPQHPNPAKCRTLMLQTAAALGDEALSETKPLFLDANCNSPTRCASAHRQLAALYRSKQRWLPALEHSQMAAKLAPSWAAWLEAAQLAARAGQQERARLHLERAARLAKDEDPSVRERIESVRKQLLRAR